MPSHVAAPTTATPDVIASEEEEDLEEVVLE
jgi:hypothetical protein